MIMKDVAEILRHAEIKKARGLIRRLTESNRKQPLYWIASASLEEEAGEMEASRVLRKGFERITDFIVLWKAMVELATKSNEKDLILLL
ncbi:hypothetical protein L3X38_024512 [Prunus dulcis]|uniref:Uncharacterized protein n=1 Tax=Prunus dulcis TaxID=3755 RepID=A0AAD4VZY3_PRUDU|nr:hypothetical protein L3X38_024512 [Prunus dulcis]